MKDSAEQSLRKCMWHFNNWLKAIRFHQWSKNALLFVPVLTSFSFDSRSLVSAGAAFLSFSCLASATYLANDWKDLDSDRGHPRKRHRPIASGAISIPASAAMAAILMGISAIFASILPIGFQAMLGSYLLMTLSYTFLVKGYFLLDVILIALLYTWRILAGSLAIGTTTSSWLLGFSGFFFLGLSLIKRCADLRAIEAGHGDRLPGRDYSVADYAVMQSLGTSSSTAAMVIFCLYINSPETLTLYATPSGLWLVACAILYWSARLWVKAARGEITDDPVVFALRDRGSRSILLFIVAIILAAHFIDIESLPIVG